MQVGEVLAERFEIEEHIESGGMGSVFRALDRETSSPVAIKALDARGGADAERARREAQVLAQLRHPGIVRYIAHGTSGFGEPFVVMEWLSGLDLARRLERQGLTAAESLTLARGAAEALAYAHERSIVHRDIKPANLFLVEGEVSAVKIVDFGIARSIQNTRALTRAGWLVGTPGYIAPEQARGERDIGPPADVFSLGCVLFECLTGAPPFVGEHAMAMLAKILLTDAPRVSSLAAGIPPELDDLVARMLAKDPRARPADGARLLEELCASFRLDDQQRAPVRLSAPPPALTGSEQQLFTVILAGSTLGTAEEAQSAPTIAMTDAADELDPLRRRLQAFGARVDRLAGDVVVATVVTTGTAADQATRAARCALALREARPGAPLVLATGRGVLAGYLPVGEVIERAAALLPRASPADIALDEVSAGLLDERFDVSRRDGLPRLAGERRAAEPVRTLLGKPTSCVGRERELGLLDATLEECAGDSVARAVLVVAPTGVGKSRLRYEFLRRVEGRDDGVRVWLGRGDSMGGGAPFGLVARALRRAANLLDGEPLSVRRDKVRAWVRGLAGDARVAAEFVGELVGTPFAAEGNVELSAARADPLLMGDRMRLAFEDLIGAATASAPLLLVFEDLHWGDLPSVQFVDSALRAHRGRPIMVLALARPEALDEFPKLWAGRNVQTIELGELSRRACERLVRETLGDTPAPLVERIVERAAGNAFYLEELIRAVAEGRLDELPETVVAMVQSRLQALRPDLRRLLRAASVFGPVFWEGGVAQLLGEGGRTFTPIAWTELVEAELVGQRAGAKFPGERELTFRSVLFREASYAMLTDADRALGHRLAGAWLEQTGESDAFVLAGHFERGGERARAARAYRQASEQALEGNDFARAIACAERGVACDPEGPFVGLLRLSQTDALAWQGRLADSSAAAALAMVHLERGSPPWFRAVGEAASTTGRRGDIEGLRAHLATLRAVEATGDALAQKIIAASQACRQLYKVGLVRDADAVCDELDQLVRVFDPPPPLVLAAWDLAHASRALHTGALGVFLDFTERAGQRFEEAGDLRNACSTKMGVGYGYLELGALHDAERALRAGVEMATRIGSFATLAAVKHNLGLALALLGSFAEAEALEREALAMFEAHGEVRLGGASRNYLAKILTLAGRRGEAEAVLRETLSAAALNPAVRANALAMLVPVLLPERPAEALEAAKSAMAVVDELGGIEAGEALIRLAYIEARLAVGDAEEAARSAALARDRLLARAARLGDARWRESFLTQVPENARTIALSGGLPLEG
jgi:tetratricopeptide (TPR) repeat protein